MNTIGQNIACFRKRKGMTQEELAEKMAVTAQAVSKWECDTSYPDITVMQTLAKVLGVTVAELIEGERDLPEMKEAPPEVIDRRIVLIEVHAEGANVVIRFPVPALAKMMDNGVLEKIVGEEAYGEVSGFLCMIDSGIVGHLIDVDTPEAKIVISVEHYEN